MLRRLLRAAIRTTKHWLEDDRAGEGRDERYDTLDRIDDPYARLRETFLTVVGHDVAARRPAYAWGLVHGAHLARRLGIERISAIEFGVAGGNGLVALEAIAERTQDAFGLAIDVYGFDTATGLPRPVDYRDMPNLFAAGTYSMDETAVRAKLRRARLILGEVERTLPGFLASRPSPVAFVALDLDLYSSTVHALRLLDADPGVLLPRIYCYFDDILAATYSDYTGERLAIAEFNAAHPTRKLSPVYGLRYFVPPGYSGASWVEKLYMAHLFEHELYGRPEG